MTAWTLKEDRESYAVLAQRDCEEFCVSFRVRGAWSLQEPSVNHEHGSSTVGANCEPKNVHFWQKCINYHAW